MQIKRYSAPDMRRALHQVRQAQGSQAVILSSRRLPDGVEVIAADEYDAALVERLAAGGDGDGLPAGTGRELPRRGQRRAAGPADLDRLAWAVDPAIAQLRSELTTLRALLEAELRQSAAAAPQPAAGAAGAVPGTARSGAAADRLAAGTAHRNAGHGRRLARAAGSAPGRAHPDRRATTCWPRAAWWRCSARPASARPPPSPSWPRASCASTAPGTWVC